MPLLTTVLLVWALVAGGCSTGTDQRAASAEGGSSDLRSCVRQQLRSADADSCYRRAFADAGQELGATCHNALHAVGRRDAKALDLRAKDLAPALPRRPDFDCGAGYVHGLMMGVATTLETPADGARFAEICERADTRQAQQACIHGLGHVFMRAGSGDVVPALQMCMALGAPDRTGCAPGVYHDYWLAVAGQDDATRPSGSTNDVRELCAAAPEPLIEPCWFRSLTAQPPARPVQLVGDAATLCAGLNAVQRAGCLVGASTLAARDGGSSIGECSSLPRLVDALSCIRGMGMQMLTQQARDTDLETIQKCNGLKGQLQTSCVEWIGQLLAVRSNDRSRTATCPKLDTAALRAACVVGAGRSSEPIGLV